jgi:hypothetical protein
VCVCVCAAAVREMGEMEYIKGLPVLENLDLSDTPLFTKAQSMAKRFFFTGLLACTSILYWTCQRKSKSEREREFIRNERQAHTRVCKWIGEQERYKA